MMQSTDTNERNFGLGVLMFLGWFFGIIFALSGLVDMSVHFLRGLFMLLLGLTIFPPFWKFVGNKLHIKIAWYYKVAAFVILAILFGLL